MGVLGTLRATPLPREGVRAGRGGGGETFSVRIRLCCVCARLSVHIVHTQMHTHKCTHTFSLFLCQSLSPALAYTQTDLYELRIYIFWHTCILIYSGTLGGKGGHLKHGGRGRQVLRVFAREARAERRRGVGGALRQPWREHPGCRRRAAPGCLRSWYTSAPRRRCAGVCAGGGNAGPTIRVDDSRNLATGYLFHSWAYSLFLSLCHSLPLPLPLQPRSHCFSPSLSPRLFLSRSLVLQDTRMIFIRD